MNFLKNEILYKKICFACVFGLISLQLQALEYEPQFENEKVNVCRVKIFPHEEIGRHRDANPQVVVALQGGVITCLEEDGRMVDVEFPVGVPVFRPVDPENQFHKSVNNSDKAVELIIVSLK